MRGDKELARLRALNRLGVIVADVCDKAERLDCGGLVLGVFEDIDLEDRALELGVGDALVLFTDGVAEATNSTDDPFGHRRLIRAIRKAPRDAEGMVSHILDDLADFTGEAPRPDDITILTMVRE